MIPYLLSLGWRAGRGVLSTPGRVRNRQEGKGEQTLPARSDIIKKVGKGKEQRSRSQATNTMTGMNGQAKKEERKLW